MSPQKKPRISLGQNLRVRYEILKRTYRLKRKLTEKDFQDIIAHIVDEDGHRTKAIGLLTILWAQVEIALDVTNGILILDKRIQDTELPRSLNPKIKFFRKNIAKIPELAPFVEETLRLAGELNRIKDVRHDAVHGVAIEKLSAMIRKVLRVKYDGKDLKIEYTEYGLDDLTKVLNDTIKLKDDLYAHFVSILRVLYPDIAKQFYG